MRLVLVIVLLAGCGTTPDFGYSDAEPGPGAGGPYGGDGTIEMVVAYFSFKIERDDAQGDMGSHCGFSDWTLDPTTVKLHVGPEAPPQRIVMREIHPDQSTQGIGHFGTAPTPIWRGHHIPRAFGSGDLGTVVFGDGIAAFRGVAIPTQRWLLVETQYTDSDGAHASQVTETLHLRHFLEVPVALDQEHRLCM